MTTEYPGGANVKPYEAFLQDELRDPELAAAYLTAALTEGSTEEFLLALRSVADVTPTRSSHTCRRMPPNAPGRC